MSALREGKRRVAILGAGPAGLAAAYYLSEQGFLVDILDRVDYVGGGSASFRIKDYIVDYGPHAFHVKNKTEINRYIMDLTHRLLGDDRVEVERVTRVILDGKNMAYPLEIREALTKVKPLLSLKILVDYLLKHLDINNHRPARSFQQWGVSAFGKSLYKLAFGSYSEKMWGLSGDLLSNRLAQQKLLKLDLSKLILNMIGFGDRTYESGVSAYFDLYPRFGMGTLFEKITQEIREKGGKFYFNVQIEEFFATQDNLRSLSFKQGSEIKKIDFDFMISTIPLHFLAKFLAPLGDFNLLSLSGNLKYRDIRVIYMVLDREFYSNVHWFYLLDGHFKFNRLSEQKNLNKESSPAGKTVISLDIACNYDDEIWNMSEANLYRLALQDLKHFNLTEDHIMDYFTLRLRDIYPIYTLDFDIYVRKILEIIRRYSNLFSAGRQGLFLNNDIHDSMEMGIMASKYIENGKRSADWYSDIIHYIEERLEGKVK